MDLVTFGEAMVRLTPPASQRLEQAHSFDVHVGGGELNVAVAAARLGVTSRWVSLLPDDPLGRMIANRGREQGVDVHVEWTADDRAGLYFAELGAAPRASSVLYDRAGSAISRIKPGSIDWASVFDGARWFHVSGITPALSESAAMVTGESLVAAKKAGLTVSYDLNYRSKLWSAEKARAVQEPLMEHVDVLITTEEDTRVVFGIGGDKSDSYDRVDAESYAQVARTLGERFDLRAVSVTLRENPRVLLNTWSAIVVSEGNVHRAPRYEVEVVDRIGAGDAFSAGLIVSRLEDRGWEDAVRFATATSALKHTIPGDFCLVTRSEVDQLLRGASLRVSR
ncbi:MAG: 2-dehydro-3-deoxygluconokinase [Gemmatimonadaceae bacterium]|jgi:2-dehydro-3-deoxygluconokinase|nr:2-dehydro-3-deoxygluconokinase [Gemmatimonadaceae bacterium]